jgi:hypothetical protein
MRNQDANNLPTPLVLNLFAKPPATGKEMLKAMDIPTGIEPKDKLSGLKYMYGRFQMIALSAPGTHYDEQVENVCANLNIGFNLACDEIEDLMPGTIVIKEEDKRSNFGDGIHDILLKIDVFSKRTKPDLGFAKRALGIAQGTDLGMLTKELVNEAFKNISGFLRVDAMKQPGIPGHHINGLKALRVARKELEMRLN